MSPNTTADTFPVVLNVANNSGLLIALHPLTLLNISDHYTRTKIQRPSDSLHAIGALLGVQTGREVEVFNSYELLFDERADGSIAIEPTYFLSKQEQFRQVFPSYDFLGWYAVGSVPTLVDVDIHQQLSAYNESPLFLQLDPDEVPSPSRSLPITIYESTIDIVDGAPQTMFIKAPYKVETGEAERIAVDHVAHASTKNAEGGENSSLIAHLTGQRNAIKMLHNRITLLHQYLVDTNNSNPTPGNPAGNTSAEVTEPALPKDHDIERQILSLCNRLPTISGKAFEDEFLKEYNDVLLTSYLATITKGTNTMSDMVDKFNSIQRNSPSKGRVLK